MFVLPGEDCADYACDDDEDTQEEDGHNTELLFERHADSEDLGDWETDDDYITEDVEQNGDPVIDPGLFIGTCPVRVIHIPNAVDRKALEDDVEEDSEPRSGKQGEDNIVDSLVVGSIRQTFVEANHASLDQPQRSHIKSRPWNDHLHHIDHIRL